MKLLIATLTAFPWNEVVAGEFRQLAARDRVREHGLADRPEEADAILMVDLHQHADDWRLALLDRHPLVRRFPHKVFVYDERDHPWCRWPGVYVSMRRNAFDPARQRAWSYSQILNAFPTPVVAEPDLLYSFQGACSHPVRAKVLALRHPRGVVDDPRFNFFDYTGHAHTAGYQAEKTRHEDLYRRTVGRSKFVLCPRGSGTSSFRLYETLSAGRVPVIISDEWVAPSGPAWDRCSVRIEESQVDRIPQILEAREEDFGRLAATAAQVYRDWFAPEVMFHRLAGLCEDLRRHGKTGRNPRHFLDRVFLRYAARAGKARVKRLLGSAAPAASKPG